MFGEELLDESFQQDDPAVSIRFTDPFTDRAEWSLERSVCLAEVRPADRRRRPPRCSGE